MNLPKKEHGFVGCFLAAATFALYVFNPSQSQIFMPCPFYYATGCYCPGCGSLRALHNLLHGDIKIAMTFNPLMVISIPLIGVMLINPSWIYRRWVPWGAFGILISYGIIRNLSIYPFCLLAPK